MSLGAKRGIPEDQEVQEHSLTLFARHFDVVTFLAWGVGTGGPWLDDQDGNFACGSKAYGPWEAIQLLARDPAKAKINIENYVWYALVSHSSGFGSKHS